jgi:SAM-dependent methyltransferase
LLETETEQLAGAGFNVVVADLTREALDQQFDLIVAGEVLEHVDAPGKFMKNCASMLSPEGRLAITVPNPRERREFTDLCRRVDHVCCYGASTLVELGQRNGLRLAKFVSIAVRKPKKVGAKLFFHCVPS